jgi:transketolase
MNIRDLEAKASEIRQDVIKMLVHAGSGHSAGPLGSADIFTALYFEAMENIDGQNPENPDRDRFVLSCGHYCPVLYATLAHKDFFPHSELATLRKFGGRLHGHPHNEALPGIENSSGPLGQGLSQAAGMAYTAKYFDDKSWRTFCFMSDGEQQEGQIWEAAMFASKYKLSNLTGLIDRNNIQIDGPTEIVMPLEPFASKWKAYGWNVIEVDGHNIEEIVDACNHARAIQERPTVIICNTIPGKGVDFMENKFEWHGKPPKEDEARKALHELRTLGGKIRGEHE